MSRREPAGVGFAQWGDDCRRKGARGDTVERKDALLATVVPTLRNWLTAETG
jgi:hypothetical protein